MPRFPQSELEIVTLAATMEDGFVAHAADFPNANVMALGTKAATFNTAKTAQLDAAAAAMVATEAKNTAMAALEEEMRDQLKQAEVDTGNDPVKLAYIGWAPRADAAAVELPGQVRNLEAVVQGAGTLFLDWKAPAMATGGPVRTYVIEKRVADGAGVFGSWQQVGIAIESETLLTGQERGPQLEYRVVAVNTAGQGAASNTVAVVL